jgi:hypothetical protein
MSPIVGTILILNLVVFLSAWLKGDKGDGANAVASVIFMVLAAIVDVIAFLVWAIAKIFQVH